MRVTAFWRHTTPLLKRKSYLFRQVECRENLCCRGNALSLNIIRMSYKMLISVWAVLICFLEEVHNKPKEMRLT